MLLLYLGYSLSYKYNSPAGVGLDKEGLAGLKTVSFEVELGVDDEWSYASLVGYME